ncbi:MAG: gspF, partial [Acidimicrobiales bacterium]|nr:gspF [Acidimicrobiales bacterium]
HGSAARTGRPRSRYQPSPGRLPRATPPQAAAIGATVLFLAGAWTGGPAPGRVLSGLALVLGGLAARAALVRGGRRRRERAVARTVPDLVDLFVVAASAGHPVPSCLRAVADRAPPPLRAVVASARDRVAQGEGVAVALGEVAEVLGPHAGPLVDALVDSHRTGAPLVASLDRAAEAARDVRRRRAEERARRLPVTLLFPLVCCVLPAFGCLAVIPLLVASLRSLAG